jgi:hypothetical protein
MPAAFFCSLDFVAVACQRFHQHRFDPMRAALQGFEIPLKTCALLPFSAFFKSCPAGFS